MKYNKKVVVLIVSFLLLIPFRLPISVLLIKLFNAIAQLEGTELPAKILRANVFMTKLVYNLAVSGWMAFNVEHLIRQINGRKHNYQNIYNITILTIIALFIYACFDGYWIYRLFDALALNKEL